MCTANRNTHNELPTPQSGKVKISLRFISLEKTNP